jgi:hypothetical protein
MSSVDIDTTGGTDDGGPAFPQPSASTRDDGTHHMRGLTMRDYFAAAALQGSLSTIEDYSQELKRINSKTPLNTFMARLAYAYADAMLEARKS